jgi:hypothetical protein
MEDITMNDRTRSPWTIGLLVVAVSVAAGLIAYNLGLSQRVAEATIAAATTATPPNAPPTAYPYPYAYPYGWHRPWGFGFLFPFVFLFFWVFIARSFWWRGGWYAGGPRLYQDRFDEMHRRAHDRMNPKE